MRRMTSRLSRTNARALKYPSVGPSANLLPDENAKICPLEFIKAGEAVALQAGKQASETMGCAR